MQRIDFVNGKWSITSHEAPVKQEDHSEIEEKKPEEVYAESVLKSID